MGTARKGFSIIEVLVAVVITSIAGMALMESAAQGRRAYDTAVKHQKDSELAALIALSSNTMGGAGESDLATLMSTRYLIDNVRITEKLKPYHFVLKTERSHIWDVQGEGNETQRAVALISANAIEQTMIETDGVRTTLYGLSGEGW
ncbi:prepilin-type N-terminal cleavage/methylation domain-containing protein [Sulfuricurvum sp.]|uniref:type IV pilus modification PilV family protein n=1 Tax=Sulfuricurvum sp. TaxID=2025608 RepID=UPI00262061EF|nr:prepilin-type N-terminal cleavage/methylation domain-containing protein [Sulfuricurvum sp.]MDD2266735.1 prepilin-type N-terminal cleavage/methylation domain-containing protein [Sulfuricurvum sp.]MDD2783903.1 prepilin-type N-terminal cleavage/methylation domain-containing protein [Sulfuricurvum sp.]